MDLYSYINSKAISNYLREIKYEFDTKEAAWLIFQCKSISVEERHNTWKQIIQEMPDCELEERQNCLYRESLHALVTEYISITENQLEKFNRQEAEAIYQYRYSCPDYQGWCEDYENIYDSLDKCWEKSKNKKMI